MKLRFFLLACFISGTAHATVTVTTATWTSSLAYGSTVTATTTGAGSKPVQAKTYCFANFENLSAGVAPSTWSVATSFSDISHLSTATTNCFNGSGCVGNDVDMNGLKTFTAAVNFPDVGAGGKIMMSVEWYRDEGAGSTDWPTQALVACNDSPVIWNLKTYRLWPNSVGNQNDLYGGQQCDGGFINFNESHNGFATTGIDRVYTNRLRPQLNAHQQVEWYFQLNSNASSNSTDGQIIINQGGTNIVANSTFRTQTSLDTGNGRWTIAYPVHMDWANNTFPTGNIRYDNVVFDTGWCAVWVTTVSTNMLSATKYFMPVISWSNTQVQFAWAQKLTSNTSYYVYVQDNSRNVNSSGLSVLTSASGGGGPTNMAPTVSAGSNQTITLPATASLSGTASDDGLPNPPATLTTTWSKVSGSGTVTFGNTALLSTTATFSVADTYVLRLTGDDSALQSTSDVTIIVNPVPTSPSSPSGKTFQWKRHS